MANTTKLDLDRDYSVNGRTYPAGSSVEVENQHVDAIKEMQTDGARQHDYEVTHHGAVPMHNDPQEATAQTPTRPLAAPVVIQEAVLRPQTDTGAIVEVKDPAANGEGRSADESNKDVLQGSTESIVANEDQPASVEGKETKEKK